MAIDIDTVAEIDPNNPTYRPLLEEIQGNILTGFDRNYNAHLFLTFNNRIPAIKEWIARFAQESVTSALSQWERGKTGLAANFCLSMVGYMHLQFSFLDVPQGSSFRQGMKDPNSQATLGDPPVDKWESPYREELHALVLLADDDSSALQAKVRSLQEQLLALTSHIHVEWGFVMRNGEGKAIEHFGFRDGISQPLFLKSDIDRARSTEGGFNNWDPRAPLNLVLSKDPMGKTEESYGSFLVYRKLEKNVPGWDRNLEELAKELGIEADLVGALVVGRFQDSTPRNPRQGSQYGGEGTLQQLQLPRRPTGFPLSLPLPHSQNQSPRGHRFADIYPCAPQRRKNASDRPSGHQLRGETPRTSRSYRFRFLVRLFDGRYRQPVRLHAGYLGQEQKFRVAASWFRSGDRGRATGQQRSAHQRKLPVARSLGNDSKENCRFHPLGQF